MPHKWPDWRGHREDRKAARAAGKEGPVDGDKAEPGLVKGLKEKIKLKYGDPGETLYYPLDLVSQVENGRECMRIGLISRDLMEKKAIYFLTPTGLTIPDGTSWNNVDLGTLVGGALGMADKAKAAFSAIKGGGSAASPIGIEDIIAASTITAAQRFAPTLLGTKGMMTAGLAANPYTNTQFAGTNLRNFEFTFKMIAESSDESETARLIENTFRKFLYPRQHPESDMVLVYPPQWKIEFLKDGEPNPHLPMIHFCNLTNLSVTYNATGNSFHTDGSPTEIDMSLSFMEARALTRDDLYGSDGEAPGYMNDSLNYEYDNLKLNTPPKPTAAPTVPINPKTGEAFQSGTGRAGSVASGTGGGKSVSPGGR